MTRPEPEPEFFAQEYITITRDSRTGLIVAIGGTEQAASLLQQAGFVDAPSPRGTYHRLPRGLSTRLQQVRATAASHALLSAGHSVYLDPALNAFATPDEDRQAARRHLGQLARRAFHAESAQENAAILTEIAGPDEGLLHLIRNALTGTYLTWTEHLKAAGADTGPAERLLETTRALSRTVDRILDARNQAALTPSAPATPAAPAAGPSSASGRRR
jgi:hypothetical protein